MIDQELRKTVRAQVAAIPPTTGDLDRVLARGRRRRRATRAGQVGALSVVVVVGLLAAVTGVPGTGGPVASGGVARLELTDGFDVRVVDRPVRSNGALVYQALPGPEPGFDTTSIGTEIPVVTGPPSALVVPISDNPVNALQADRMVYLGDVDQAQVALHVFGGDLCLFLGNHTEVAGGGTCGADGFTSGDALDPPVGNWAAWSGLSEGVAVVTVTTADGRVFWQRPVGRTVFFHLPDDSAITRDMLVGLDPEGNEVATPP
jgi:hypothetical protein